MPRSDKPAVPTEHDFAVFIGASAIDLFMTYVMLRHGGFTESNPVAQYFIASWGVKGMVYYKFGMVAVISTIAFVVAQSRPHVAQRLLWFATFVVTLVVLYSLALFLRHGGAWVQIADKPLGLQRESLRTVPTVNVVWTERSASSQGQDDEQFLPHVVYG